jgi:hypothetical protein
MRISRSAIVRSARTSPGEETKTRMVFIMLRNGEGPLDPVPEAALVQQSAKPLRPSVGDTRRFEAVGARKSRTPNDVHQSRHGGGAGIEAMFGNQKKLGVIPATAKPDGLPARDSLGFWCETIGRRGAFSTRRKKSLPLSLFIAPALCASTPSLP